MNLLNQTLKMGHVTGLASYHSEAFESAYVEVRNKEGRILNDQQVSKLPYIEQSSAQYKEWLCRQHSSELILRDLGKKTLGQEDWILDIGCGNGWFSHLLAQNSTASVLAIDINKTELEQAARVFKRPNLFFAYLDLIANPQSLAPCKLIYLNSSFQYFDNPRKLLDLCLSLLVDDGEIHILDTPVYPADEVSAAKQRSHDYYDQLQAPQMKSFYHHQSYALFDDYDVEFLYTPALKPVRAKTDSPFPWLKLTRKT